MTTSSDRFSLEWGKENLDLVKNSSIVLGILTDVLRKRLTALEKEETSPEHFDKPSWNERQAYLLGRKKELTETLRLLKG